MVITSDTFILGEISEVMTELKYELNEHIEESNYEMAREVIDTLIELEEMNDEDDKTHFVKVEYSPMGKYIITEMVEKRN